VAWFVVLIKINFIYHSLI